MTQAIGAYREVVVSPKFRELERLRADALHNEASALASAERRGEEHANAKWQDVVTEKDAALADQEAEILRLRAQLEMRNENDN